MEIAYYSWAYDAMQGTNAMGMVADALLRNTVSAGTIQANDFLYHGLNGMNAEVARLVTGAAVNMAGTNRDLGLAIHPYTDAYFHTTTGGIEGLSWLKAIGNTLGGNFQYDEGTYLYNYNGGLGHGLNFTLPDSINGRMDLFTKNSLNIYSTFTNYFGSTASSQLSLGTVQSVLTALTQVPDAQRIDFVKYMTSGQAGSFDAKQVDSFNEILSTNGLTVTQGNKVMPKSYIMLDSNADQLHAEADGITYMGVSDKIRNEGMLDDRLEMSISNQIDKK